MVQVIRCELDDGLEGHLEVVELVFVEVKDDGHRVIVLLVLRVFARFRTRVFHSGKVSLDLRVVQNLSKEEKKIPHSGTAHANSHP